MELRQNWHKFQRLLGPLPPKKPSLLVLHSHHRILSGALALSGGSSGGVGGFQEVGTHIDPIDSAWEVLSHKYEVNGGCFVDNEELVNALGQVASVRPTPPATDHFYAQIVRLRELMGLDRGEKSKLAVHMGDRPLDQYWPRKNFLLSIFQTFFGELFPERKLVLVGVVNDSHSMESILLEFHGPDLKGFCEPDFSGIDWKGSNLFDPETAQRFVAWSESHHMLPAYSLFVSRRLWDECREVQLLNGERAAWKLLAKANGAKEEREMLFEPEPWPLRALVRWHSLRR